MAENDMSVESTNETATQAEVATQPEATTPAEATTQTEAQTQDEAARAKRKERVGKVVSDKMEKTVVVSLTRRVPHPLYKKYFKKTTKFVAHDETNDAKTGDTVRIMETRPTSKTKRWRVIEVLERAK
jgi:small subunit ribosomal protein S17